MGGINVKNTIVERVLEIIAPHPCSGCGKTGTLLCDDCKYDIICEPFLGCILCAEPCLSGLCSKHQTPIMQAFTVSSRGGALEVLINKLKFQRTKAAAFTLAKLLDDYLPILPANTRIVPVPTVRSHVRQRGYDQVDLVARHFARLRGLTVEPVLTRLTTATQHTSSRAEREVQATRAFGLSVNQTPLSPYPALLIDDILTTGSTITQAAAVLRRRFSQIYVATLAYQPLD